MAMRRLELDDSDLVDALRAGRTGAMEVLYERYSVHVQKVLVRVLGIDPVIPELLHDVFIEAFTHINAIKDSSKLKGWLTSIAVFSARGYIRKRTRSLGFWFGETSELPEVATLGSDYDVREALRCIYLILDRLPTDERIAFALRFIEGMELTEVADASRVSLATIKRRLSRAQKKFVNRAMRYPALQEWIDRSERWRGMSTQGIDRRTSSVDT